MTADPSANRRPEGLRVIIVEDETLIALLLESMLEDLGHVVVGMAATVNAAVELASHEEADLAVLDVNLAGQESYAAVDAFAARNVPYVLVTGYDPGRLRPQYRVRPILQKPYLQHDLKEAIERACN